MTNPKYIPPPSPDEVQWFDGPPPEVGWWPADYEPRDPNMIRWWDGRQWSCAAMSMRTAVQAEGLRNHRIKFGVDSVQWSPRWWLPQPTKTDSTKTAAIDPATFWRKIGPDAPKGVKVQLINRSAGVATYGTLPSRFHTHWAPLPVFGDDA